MYHDHISSNLVKKCLFGRLMLSWYGQIHHSYGGPPCGGRMRPCWVLRRVHGRTGLLKVLFWKWGAVSQIRFGSIRGWRGHLWELSSLLFFRFLINGVIGYRVADMGYWVGDRWECVFRWKRELWMEEFMFLEELLQAVEGKVTSNSSDAWSWIWMSMGIHGHN